MLFKFDVSTINTAVSYTHLDVYKRQLYVLQIYYRLQKCSELYRHRQTCVRIRYCRFGSISLHTRFCPVDWENKFLRIGVTTFLRLFRLTTISSGSCVI